MRHFPPRMFLIIVSGILGATSSLWAAAPASQPAAGFTPIQQKALEEIIKNLEALRADEKSLPAIQAYLDQQKRDLTGQLEQTDVEVRKLQGQLQALTQKRDQLASRIQSIQIGKVLLAANPPAPTSAPAATPPTAAPAAPAATLTASNQKPELALFVQQIKPVLISQCFNCHGGQHKKGGLDLSTHDQLVKGGDTGPAIVPGKSKESLLFKLITHSQDPHMPAKAPKLPDETIERIAKWIDSGAPYDGPLTLGKQAAAPSSQPTAAQVPQHWAFKPVVRHDAPAVKQKSWVRNPIDAFVLEKLESAGFQPSPEADRRTLIRRLSLDLIGLLPKPSEVEDFVRDTRPDAYERVVDRLLASPHYGERWGRHWLDLARYADSDGYEKDSQRPHAWRWRDWVIDAINRDMPFDQFTVEQLAGDLLPNATLEQRVATGFHRNTLTNKEGGVDQEEYRVKAVVDRVNTTGSVWLGLTVGCAQCHTHKYDPIAHREYYQLFSFFNTSMETDQPAPLPKDVESYTKAKTTFDQEHARLVGLRAAYEKDQLPARQAAWEHTLVKQKPVAWTVLQPLIASSNNGATLTSRPDGVVLASGKNPEKDSYILTFKTQLTGITAIRVEALSDVSLPNKGPGRVGHGNFVLSGASLSVSDLSDTFATAAPVGVRFARAEADHEQNDGPYHAANTLDGKPGHGWAIMPQAGQDHQILFETSQAVGFAQGSLLTLKLDFDFGDHHTIGKLRVAATTAGRPVGVDRVVADIRTIAAIPVDKRTPAQKERIDKHWLTIDDQHISLAKSVDEHAKKAPPVPSAQMLAEDTKPRATHIMIKGDFLRPGEEVTSATLSVLHPLKPRSAKPDRLDLAKWLVDPTNPLTARVTVNRLWNDLFGQGLVTTLDDFGMRSQPPSHPELLDWLASEFIARGWSQKAMIKLIVTSATYRQSSHVRAELMEKDPKNVLLARQSRFRVEAEIVRDLTLQAGHLLNERVGGPSFFPPLPRDLANLVYANSLPWTESKSEEKHRRGMYIHFQRTIPYPMLMAFDEPDSNVTCTRRDRSDTPLQSLTLLNNGEFFECAQALGLDALRMTVGPVQASKGQGEVTARLVADPVEQTRKAEGFDREGDAGLAPGIRLIYLTCLGREPEVSETARLARLWHEIGELSSKDAKSASQMVGSPQIKLAAAELPQAAGWIAVARTVMNLDEFVTRE